MSCVWFVTGGWLFACATTATRLTSSDVCLGLYSLSRLWVFCVAYLRYGILPPDQTCFRLVSFRWNKMNLEAVSLHLIVNACIDVVAH